MDTCLFRLRTVPRCIRHRRRFGSVPPDPRPLMRLTIKAKQFPQVLFMSPGKFSGKKANKKPWRKHVFSTAFLLLFSGALCALQASASAGRPGTVVGLPYLLVTRSFNGDKATSFHPFTPKRFSVSMLMRAASSGGWEGEASCSMISHFAPASMAACTRPAASWQP